MEIADILWETNKPYLKKFMRDMCNAYGNDPRYAIRKFYDGLELKGFCVRADIDGIRVLSEAHYTGEDKTVALKMWKWLTKGAKVLRASVFCNNRVMLDCLKRLGFKEIDMSGTNVILQRDK